MKIGNNKSSCIPHQDIYRVENQKIANYNLAKCGAGGSGNGRCRVSVGCPDDEDPEDTSFLAIFFDVYALGLVIVKPGQLRFTNQSPADVEQLVEDHSYKDDPDRLEQLDAELSRRQERLERFCFGVESVVDPKTLWTLKRLVSRENTQSEVAKALAKSPSSVCREVERVQNLIRAELGNI